jgi:predicted nucleic acid-binding Zn ribbon protein
MKECLKCKKQFESKTGKAKFCSTSCRVMYNRKQPKKNVVTHFHLMALYNEFKAAIQDFAAQGNKIPATVYNTSKPKIQEMEEEISLYSTFYNAINNAESTPEIENIINQVFRNPSVDWSDRMKLKDFATKKSYKLGN